MSRDIVRLLTYQTKTADCFPNVNFLLLLSYLFGPDFAATSYYDDNSQLCVYTYAASGGYIDCTVARGGCPKCARNKPTSEISCGDDGSGVTVLEEERYLDV